MISCFPLHLAGPLSHSTLLYSKQSLHWRQALPTSKPLEARNADQAVAFALSHNNPTDGPKHYEQLSHLSDIQPGWDNNGKPGNQVATKSLPSSEIFCKNPALIIIYVNLIY